MSAFFWSHKFKCRACSLHFIVCSDFQDWVGQHSPTCPECGNQSSFLYWRSTTEGFIFNAVPGDSEIIGYLNYVVDGEEECQDAMVPPSIN